MNFYSDNFKQNKNKILFITPKKETFSYLKFFNKSLKCFQNPNKDFSKNYYIFVVEDLSQKKVIGVSMIHAQHGTENEPHFFLRVSPNSRQFTIHLLSCPLKW